MESRVFGKFGRSGSYFPKTPFFVHSKVTSRQRWGFADNRFVVVEAELFDRFVGVDFSGDDVAAVEHAEDALADRGDVAGVGEVSVLEDDLAMDDDEHGGGLAGFEPRVEGFQAGRRVTGIFGLDGLPIARWVFGRW